MSGKQPKRDELIASLVGGLSPVRAPGKTRAKALLWLGLATFVTIAIMLARAPFRPAFIEQLGANPRFLIESLCGIAAIILAARFSFAAAVPAAKPSFALRCLPFVVATAWIAFYLYGLIDPALPVSMAGKRPHCFVEVLILGLPALIAGVFALRTFYPLRGSYSGALIGFAAGAIPALAMQFACMYINEHILTHHILPGLALALCGACAGYFFIRPK